MISRFVLLITIFTIGCTSFAWADTSNEYDIKRQKAKSLAGIYIDLTNKTLFADSPQYKNETKNDLEKLRFSYGHFYWNLYNSHDHCYDPKEGIQMRNSISTYS